jgi:adenylate cyclase
MTVLFADITDSTSLYQKLGDAAARNVINACLTLVASVLPRYNGRVVKTMGDELMCIFPSADLSVLAASEMQSLAASTKPADHAVVLHIGLHHGPVLVEEDDVFGDTVNAAAYLTAVATAGQILTTGETERSLSAPLKSCVRPIFYTTLKGSDRKTTVYQVLWRTEAHDVTDVKLHPSKSIPGDTGSLLVTLDEKRVRVDQSRTTIVVGRQADCDLVVKDQLASRRHLSIKLVNTHFYLFDHSTNGTFLALNNGEELHLLRREMVLDGSGEIRAGRSRREGFTDVIVFERDRRSLFRPPKLEP